MSENNENAPVIGFAAWRAGGGLRIGHIFRDNPETRGLRGESGAGDLHGCGERVVDHFAVAIHMV